MAAVITRLSLLLLCLGFAPNASASLVTFTFAGQQALIPIGDSPDGAIGTAFSPGDTISGWVTFDTTTPGDGIYVGAVTDLYFEVSTGYSGSASTGDLYVQPIPMNNFFRAESFVVNADDIGLNSLLFFNLAVNGDFLGGSTAIPTVPPPVTPLDDGGANTDRVELIFTDSSSNLSGIAFDLQTLELPEPTAAALLGLAAPALALLVRRRRSQR